MTWPLIELESKSRSAALEATEESARAWFERRILLGWRPRYAEGWAADLTGRLAESQAGNELLSFRVLHRSWGPDAVAYVLGGIVAARGRQIEISLDSQPVPAPYGGSVSDLRGRKRQLEELERWSRAESPEAFRRALQVRIDMQRVVEQRWRRPRPARKPWSPARHVAEAVEGLQQGTRRLDRDAFTAQLCREVLDENVTPGRIESLMRAPRRERRTEKKIASTRQS